MWERKRNKKERKEEFHNYECADHQQMGQSQS